MTQLSLRYGLWTVVDNTRDHKRRVLCRCACGCERFVFEPDLRRGRSEACWECAQTRLERIEKARRNALVQPRADGRFASNEDSWVRDADGTIRRAG